MSVLSKIAFFQNRRDEIPNQQLARWLAEMKDEAGIREIAENLWNKNQNVQSDCLKVLYEIGYIRPELIAAYAEDFLKLLRHKNNRMVWGGMIALSTVATIQAEFLYDHVEEIKRVMDKGSVITLVSGIKALAAVAATSQERRHALLPYLLEKLARCRPKDAALFAEMILAAVDTSFKDKFIGGVNKSLAEATDAQAARLKKVLRQAQGL